MSTKFMFAKFKFAVPVLAATLGAAAVPALAQQQGGGGGGQNGGGGGNQGGGGGGGGNPAAQSDVAKAQADLQTTLENKDATPEDIKPKLEALRAARKAAKETPAKAQEDLKSLLTQRQEAVLVEYGMLE